MNTSPEGKRTIHSWVYSLLFLLAVLGALGLVVTSPNNPPPKSISLHVQVPTHINIVLANGEIQDIQVVQEKAGEDGPKEAVKKRK